MGDELGTRFPPQYSHSVKIEQTSKGARISVHVYSNTSEEAVAEAAQMYGNLKKRLEAEGHRVAPIDERSAGIQTIASELAQ